MWRTYFVVAVFTFFAGIAGASQPETIKRWIQQLDAEAFADREAASEALLKIGLDARAPIEAALATPNAGLELQVRGRELLEKLKLLEKRQSALQLSALLEQASLANRGKLDQAKFHTLLERLVQVWSDVSGEPKSLPVTLKDVQPLGDRDTAVAKTNALVIVDCGFGSLYSKCIVLADTAVELTSPNECIIIAGNHVRVQSPRNCIILAGEQVQVVSGENNLILSGGNLQASVLRQSVVGAAGNLNQSAGINVMHLNSPVTDRRTRDPLAERHPERMPTEVRSDAITLELPKRKNPLEGIITLTFTYGGYERSLAIFQRREGQGEYVARINQEIRAPDGTPIPELAGWKLMYCGSSGFAVFKKGEERAVLRTSEAR